VSIEPWQELERTRVFDNFRRVDEVQFQLPNGPKGPFYIAKSGRIACVLALTDDNQVILARQFRPGPMRIFNELPGGGVDAGEEPAAAAARELLEETGYAGELEYVITLHGSAYTSKEHHVYVGRHCRQVSTPHPDPTEQIEVVLLSLSEFRQQLRTGELGDIDAAYLALDHLQLLSTEN
jgi:ADP-ribose pyrophosphatase